MILGYPCGSNTTRVLYTGEKGIVTRKVCSWCMSRLGGSPARATRKTPPFCGFSSAKAAGTAHSPSTSTTLSMSPSICLRPIAASPVWQLQQRMALSPPRRLGSHADAKNKGSMQSLRHVDSSMTADQSRVVGTSSAQMEAQRTGGSSRRKFRLFSNWYYLTHCLGRVKHNHVDESIQEKCLESPVRIPGPH